jgi:stress-induced-phosphoprotein 1
MREYTKALTVLQEALDHDESGTHAKEIHQQMYKCNEALSAQRSGETEEETLERARRDPEVAVSLFLH